MRRPFIVLGATVALGMVLTACGGDDSDTTSEDGGSESRSLTIYSARDSNITDFVIERFEEEYPEYAGNVEVLNLGAQEVLERVRAEASNPQADVWWGGTQQGLDAAAAEDLLEPIEPAFAADIADEHKDPEGRWFGEILLPEVIMYNNAALSEDEAPQDWDDLIDPKWKDQIIIRDVAASGTMRSIYAAMILKESPDGQDPQPGYEWLKQLDANTAEYAANPADLYLKMSREQGILSAWNLQDILIQAEQQNMPFGYVMPASGAPVLVDGVAAVAGGDSEAATQFLEFLFDDGLRAELAADYYQIPTVEISEQPEWLANLDLQPMDVDWATIGQNETDWINYWNENIKNKG
ncbi:extracellular solute-binding protein [Jiangella rhizosphaerae]|uniref:Extracellular solute-binding protein n=1 Tax=Jiangella rhizosphaerae TaxID=2293569 RepID=A0A418KMS5_9ACTN|nr:extracellular solute-binding protein [Jiangella rhizosphaerae]RIQ20240.1 extracellular solute-binding protein [Jiangella rhizosphaerae]